MTVDRLLEAFIAEDRTGVADPAAYLARVQGVDRAELEALIDGYLARAPRRPLDRAAFEASPADRVVAALEVVGWPALLPQLRERARLRPAELVARLAAELGVGGREPKVAAYYDRMERGTLPPSGVSDRVLEALGRIVGASAAVLRAAGTHAAPPPPPAAPAFARPRPLAADFAARRPRRAASPRPPSRRATRSTSCSPAASDPASTIGSRGSRPAHAAARAVGDVRAGRGRQACDRGRLRSRRRARERWGAAGVAVVGDRRGLPRDRRAGHAAAGAGARADRRRRPQRVGQVLVRRRPGAADDRAPEALGEAPEGLDRDLAVPALGRADTARRDAAARGLGRGGRAGAGVAARRRLR